MAYISTNTAPTVAQRIAGIRQRMADAAAKRRIYRTTLNELSVLTTRELADLGIAPSMIKGIAFEAAYGK